MSITIQFRDENSASAALAQVLRSSRHAAEAFIKLCYCNDADPPPYDFGSWSVEHLHGVDTGREIDLLLHDGSSAVIVECKVDDPQKAYQLRAYRDYWMRRTGVMPKLVWLVRRPQRVAGEGTELAIVLTWNQVCDRFREIAKNLENAEASLVLDFCRAAISAEIVLLHGERPEKRKITKGYDLDHARTILEGVKQAIPGLEGSFELTNELPPRLFAGKPEWQKRFKDHWVKRLRLIFVPMTAVSNQKGPYYFRVSILFYHCDEGEKAAFSDMISHLPRWSRFCHAEGLEFEKNASGKWKGHHNIRLTYPFAVEPPLRFLFAREPVDMAQARSVFDWRNDEAAITAGAKHLAYFLSFVDQFPNS